VPLQSFRHQYVIIDKVVAEVCAKFKLKEIPHLVGTMIEIPRACLTADKIAEAAQFFSFGTNDLTQMGLDFQEMTSVDSSPNISNRKILPVDPFNVLDQEGIGQLMQIAVEKGRKTRKDLKIGICGEPVASLHQLNSVIPSDSVM